VHLESKRLNEGVFYIRLSFTYSYMVW
jgi:hypothetical protein